MASLRVGEEPTRVVLSFLSFSDVADGVRCASSGWKLTCDSEAMTHARGQAEYALRGDDHHGIVHALATAFGTRPWVRTDFRDWNFLQQMGEDSELYNLHRPPSQIRMTVCRRGSRFTRYNSPNVSERFLRYAECRLCCTSQSMVGTAYGCGNYLGSYAEFSLPCSFRVHRFSVGYNHCGGNQYARGWTFEAFDTSAQDWQILYSADGGNRHEAKRMWFEDVAPFVSDRFRIHLARSGGCMHLSGLELFGTIMPGWDVAACLDRSQPSRNVHLCPESSSDSDGD